jgi:outer membrane lipoprotein SlyB
MEGVHVKKNLVGVTLAGMVLATPVFAVDGGAVIGGAVGGGAGAAVGSAVGGRDGAIIGGAIGGATGAAIGSSPKRETVVVKERVVVKEVNHDDGHGSAPPGFSHGKKKGWKKHHNRDD